MKKWLKQGMRLTALFLIAVLLPAIFTGDVQAASKKKTAV